MFAKSTGRKPAAALRANYALVQVALYIHTLDRSFLNGRLSAQWMLAVKSRQTDFPWPSSELGREFVRLYFAPLFCLIFRSFGVASGIPCARSNPTPSNAINWLSTADSSFLVSTHVVCLIGIKIESCSANKDATLGNSIDGVPIKQVSVHCTAAFWCKPASSKFAE